MKLNQFQTFNLVFFCDRKEAHRGTGGCSGMPHLLTSHNSLKLLKHNDFKLLAFTYNKNLIHSAHCGCQKAWTVELQFPPNFSFKPYIYNVTESANTVPCFWRVSIFNITQAWPLVILQCFTTFQISLFPGLHFFSVQKKSNHILLYQM